MTETLPNSAPPSRSELRTFLIADVRGYTHFTAEHGDEAAARLAVQFAATTRQIVSAYDGQLVELRGDEALATFASARQALRAAVALEEAFSRTTMAETNLPLKVGIGLDAGEALPVEGGYRGGALNLAARLCSLAGPGEVLASEGVTHLARRTEGLLYIERGAIQLKGFEDPVRVVEVRPASGKGLASELATTVEQAVPQELPIGGYLGSLPANPVIGRGSEQARASELIEAVLNGLGKLLLLVGEPGAGKTRLAQEVTLTVRNRGFFVAAGRCYEPQQAVPFYPFVEALTSLYAVAPEDVRRQVPSSWPDLARLLPTAALPVPDRTVPPDQQRLFWTVTGFVQALAQRAPVAILLDDLHWADAASLELLQHLARHTRGDSVLLLGTYRDVEVNRQHPLEATLRDLWREGLIERLEVRRLGREETRQLIAAVLGVENVSDEFADLIYRRTEGNPFFVHQVLRAMVERGDVFRKDGRWDRKRIDEIEVPESVRSVVGRRLSRLAEDTQEALREASVLGQTFSFDELRTMSGRSEESLERSLDEAMAAGMVRETGRDGYAFDHSLTQAALYAELSSRRRRRLHLAAGVAIEALPESKCQGRAAELAWHFLEGDDPERALHWSIMAGDEAERVYAHSDAEYHYRTALQLAAEHEDRALETEVWERLGRALSYLSRYDEALEVYERVLDFHRQQGDLEAVIRVMASIGWILFEQARYEEGIARLEPALARWQESSIASPAATSLHIALGNLYWQAGRLEDALRVTERAVELATATGDARLLGVAESRLGLVLEQIGRRDEALEAYSRSIPPLEAAGDLETLGRSLNNRALVYGGRGQMAEAWADLERALEVSRRLGDPAQIAWSLGVLGWARWAVDGDWSRAQPYVEELLRLEDQVRRTRASGHIPAALWLRFVACHDASAFHDLERLAEESERDADTPLWKWAQEYLAQWDLLQGREEAALRRYEALCESPGIESQYRSIAQRRRAAVCVVCDQLERAETLLSEQRQEVEQLAWTFGWPEWLTAHARLRAAQGRWGDARADFEEALAFARKHHLALDLAESARAYGEALARRGEIDAARDRFEEALAIYRRMHAHPYIARTEHALSQLA